MRPLPNPIPTTKMVIQFKKMKIKPVLTEVEIETTLVVLPVCAANPENPKPKPTRMLKMGPAKQAVMAMLAKPFLAMVMLALKSAMELPQAKIVNPIMDPGIFKIIPTKLRTSTK